MKSSNKSKFGIYLENVHFDDFRHVAALEPNSAVNCYTHIAYYFSLVLEMISSAPISKSKNLISIKL